VARACDISQLIFVIGFPRSGTTWFSNLINSHPNTIYRHEVFGRQYGSFGEQLFRRLKFAGGLSDEDYRVALGVLRKAYVATDRPPFFRKRYRSRTPAAVQKLVWLVANASPAFAPLYTHLFTPPRGSQATLVIKETRSSINLDSIIKGVRADKVVVLIRHPYAVIASHVVGHSRGTLQPTTAAFRRSWLEHHAGCAYVMRLGLTEEAVTALDEAEFLAIWWRVQNENYLNMRSVGNDSKVVLYDEFLRDPVRNIEALLGFLSLDFDVQVRRFVLQSTSSGMRSGVLERDASSDYYSVYRGKEFDPNRWRSVLTAGQRESIDRHTFALVDVLGLNRWIEEAPAHQERAIGGMRRT